jgi:hypothetical protein
MISAWFVDFVALPFLMESPRLHNTLLQVKLYRYPCVSQGSKCKRYAGHSSKILNVRFTFDDSYLVSVGGADYSVFQWSHVDG